MSLTVWLKNGKVDIPSFDLLLSNNTNKSRVRRKQNTGRIGVIEVTQYSILIGQNLNWTASPQRQERKHLNAFLLPVRLGVQLLPHLNNIYV